MFSNYIILWSRLLSAMSRMSLYHSDLGKAKENLVFRSICTTFDFQSKVGGISGKKIKKCFYFAFRSICTTFVP